MFVFLSNASDTGFNNQKNSNQLLLLIDYSMHFIINGLLHALHSNRFLIVFIQVNTRELINFFTIKPKY